MAAAPILSESKGPATAERIPFVYEGRTVYEWKQTLEEVLIFVKPPEGIKAKMIDCKFTATRLTLGLKGNPPFINEDFSGTIVPSESMWTMEDGEIVINVQKAHKAETWPSALKGHGALDPLTVTEVHKKMMLERFQQENPGFDFSGADFNGQVPDPRNFMGGVKY